MSYTDHSEQRRLKSNAPTAVNQTIVGGASDLVTSQDEQLDLRQGKTY